MEAPNNRAFVPGGSTGLPGKGIADGFAGSTCAAYAPDPLPEPSADAWKNKGGVPGRKNQFEAPVRNLANGSQ